MTFLSNYFYTHGRLYQIMATVFLSTPADRVFQGRLNWHLLAKMGRLIFTSLNLDGGLYWDEQVQRDNTRQYVSSSFLVLCPVDPAPGGSCSVIGHAPCPLPSSPPHCETGAAVGRIMAPKGVHVPSPRICDCVTSLGKGGL